MPSINFGQLSDLTDRLAVRLLILLSFALLPLGMIAVHSNVDLARSARVSAEQALIGMGTQAVSGKRALIESALVSAQALGPLAHERLTDPADCSQFLSEFVARSGVFSFAGFIDTDGQMRCTASGDPTNLAASPEFQDLIENPRAMITATASGIANYQPVVNTTQPIHIDDVLVGFLMISIAGRSLELLGEAVTEAHPSSVVLFNQMGQVISGTTGTREAVADNLPKDTPLASLVGRGNQVFWARNTSGDPATFTVGELIPNRLFVLGAWPADAATPGGWRYLITSVLFPSLMWLASLGVIYFAVFYLVIRHISDMNSQMRRFALGDRDVHPALPQSAPSELRELASTFCKLTLIITRDEAEREADVQEKTMLLKEIHHRVKNNLQLIASILNLQMRQVEDSSAKRVLQNVQDRVLGLATIHRSLYEDNDLASLMTDRVLGDILRQLLVIGVAPGSGVATRTDIAAIAMQPDRLVPLSLLLCEAVTNALKYVGRPTAAAGDGHPGDPWIEICLTAESGAAPEHTAPGGGDEVDKGDPIEARTGSWAILTVSNSTGTPLHSGEMPVGTRLGAELIEAFATQLDGILAQGPDLQDPRGSAFTLRLRFPITS